jgi:very-short-patch-repair endonuclease
VFVRSIQTRIGVREPRERVLPAVRCGVGLVKGVSEGEQCAGVLCRRGWFAVCVASGEQLDPRDGQTRPGRVPLSGATELDPRKLLSRAGRVVHVDVVIARVAAGQKGMVTSAQLASAGLGGDAVRARVRKGRLHRVFRGAYSLSPSLMPFAREMAATLACGDGAMVSHRTAGALWGILPPAKEIHVTVPSRSGKSREGIRIHRPKTPPKRTTRHGVPTTTLDQTLLDLARTEPPDTLERALNEARAQGLTTNRRLLSLAESSATKPGAKNLRAVLHGNDTGFTRSRAERELHRLIDGAGLPRPERNVHVEGRERDAVWRKQRLVVEVDGYASHGTREAFERDRERDAELAARGWRVVRVTWRQLTGEPTAVAARLGAALYAAP